MFIFSLLVIKKNMLKNMFFFDGKIKKINRELYICLKGIVLKFNIYYLNQYLLNFQYINLFIIIKFWWIVIKVYSFYMENLMIDLYKYYYDN